MLNEISNLVPDLASARYGRSVPPSQDGQRVVLNESGVLATAEDDDVEVSRNAMVLLQFNKFALTMLCAGHGGSLAQLERLLVGLLTEVLGELGPTAAEK